MLTEHWAGIWPEQNNRNTHWASGQINTQRGYWVMRRGSAQDKQLQSTSSTCGSDPVRMVQAPTVPMYNVQLYIVPWTHHIPPSMYHDGPCTTLLINLIASPPVLGDAASAAISELVIGWCPPVLKLIVSQIPPLIRPFMQSPSAQIRQKLPLPWLHCRESWEKLDNAHFYHFPRSDWHRTIPPGTWAASRVPGPLVFHLKTQNWPTVFWWKC